MSLCFFFFFLWRARWPFSGEEGSKGEREEGERRKTEEREKKEKRKPAFRFLFFFFSHQLLLPELAFCFFLHVEGGANCGFVPQETPFPEKKEKNIVPHTPFANTKKMKQKKSRGGVVSLSLSQSLSSLARALLLFVSLVPLVHSL